MPLTERTVQFRGPVGSDAANSGLQAAEQSEGHVFGRQKALRLGDTELIVGIDFTKSNTWNGKKTFNGRCLHDVRSPEVNPYMLALNLITRTLEVYDDDHLIPCYGFGDVATGADAVFSFSKDNQPATGLDDLLHRYKEVVPLVNMSGPTSFAPLIRQAMKDVYASGMKFHVLLILADGQISQECLEDTKQALVDACAFPLSIVMLGVGDGPWDAAREMVHDLPWRPWDNFRFYDFNRIFSWSPLTSVDAREIDFEIGVMAELPEQYRHAWDLMGEDKKPNVAQLIEPVLLNVVKDPPSVD